MFLFFSMLLLCSFFRLKEIFQVKNSLTTSLLFLESAKNLGQSDDTKQRKKIFDKDIGVIDNNLPLSIFIDFHLINRFYWLLSIVIDCWLCWLHLSGHMHVVWINVLFKVLLAVFENNISLPGMMFFSLGTEWSDGFPNAILVSLFTVVFF